MNYYDEIAKGYEELHREEQIKKINLIKKHLKVKLRDRLLDVGCGTGLTTIPWKCKRYGIDPSKRLLERARQREEVVYKQAFAEKVPYRDGFFDVVISITAIQNFNDVEKGLREIKRVGRKKFVLSFLKKSPKRNRIIKLINKYFNSKKMVEEEKDIIFIID